jgi:hypothetical protein
MLSTEFLGMCIIFLRIEFHYRLNAKPILLPHIKKTQQNLHIFQRSLTMALKIRVSVVLAITGCRKLRKASFWVASNSIMPVLNFNKISPAVLKLKHEDRQTRSDLYMFILCRSFKERIKTFSGRSVTISRRRRR